MGASWVVCALNDASSPVSVRADGRSMRRWLSGVPHAL